MSDDVQDRETRRQQKASRAAQKKWEEEAAAAKKEAALDERRCKKACVLASEPKDDSRNVTMVGAALLALSCPIAKATHEFYLTHTQIT